MRTPTWFVEADRDGKGRRGSVLYYRRKVGRWGVESVGRRRSWATERRTGERVWFIFDAGEPKPSPAVQTRLRGVILLQLAALAPKR